MIAFPTPLLLIIFPFIDCIFLRTLSIHVLYSWETLRGMRQSIRPTCTHFSYLSPPRQMTAIQLYLLRDVVVVDVHSLYFTVLSYLGDPG